MVDWVLRRRWWKRRSPHAPIPNQRREGRQARADRVAAYQVAWLEDEAVKRALRADHKIAMEARAKSRTVS